MSSERTWGLVAIGLAAVVAMSMVGCSGSQPEQGRQAAQSQAPGDNGRLQITLDTGGPMTMTAAPLDVTVHEDGTPVSDADVSVELRMPASGAMGEMRTGTALKPAGDGHYRGQVDMMMAGTWNAIVRVKRGGQVVATRTQSVTAR